MYDALFSEPSIIVLFCSSIQYAVRVIMQISRDF
jgi:hypothetical protein